ncbi:MAG TPA: tetraacyldisaccharide 4'-kinase [Tepidisphaeraceae bacterium]|nr:tetraacyldisaccharide 4'-kinase [Tepidisphaeraceae bacterium]
MGLVSNSYLHRVISGEAHGITPSLLRGIFCCGELFYASATRIRNTLYDRGILASHRLPVPVISVGNITAGGTGKTPIVRWLAQGIKERNFNPAILMRGYHRSAAGISDEQALLTEQLKVHGIIVHAQPDRVAGGRHVLVQHPQTNLFILDDGFQHRRLARDIDILLIDATNPFGHGHVPPRGLLREPPTGLRRATAIIFTRCEQVPATALDAIERNVRKYTPAPIFHARFDHSGLRTPSLPTSAPSDLSLDALKSRRIFVVAAIANPTPLESSLRKISAEYKGTWWLPDHHHYSPSDLATLLRRATQAGADTIITTEKDWVKLRSLPSASNASPPILRLDLDIHLDPNHEPLLWDLITARLRRPQ